MNDGAIEFVIAFCMAGFVISVCIAAVAVIILEYF